MNFLRMIRLLLLLCCLCGCSIAHSQNPHAELSRQDLSRLFSHISMIGILGNEYSRIDIRLGEARKEGDNLYRLKGMSRTRIDIICYFKGQIMIDSIDFRSRFKDEGTDIDGFICGHYTFEEAGKVGYSGVFSGAFKQAFRLENGKIFNPVNDIVENKLNTAEYVGIWQMGDITKICNWADTVIPGIADDFCKFNDAGEWIVNPHYRKNGWDNMYNAYYNDALTQEEVRKAQAREECKWWNSNNR